MEHRKRKSYDLSFKLKAIESAEKISKESAAREFKVDPRRIREWCYQDKIVAMKKQKKSKRRRLDGGGRKAMDEHMEEALLSWIQDLRARNLPVARKMSRLKAKELTSADDFRASFGWLQCFMKRI